MDEIKCQELFGRNRLNYNVMYGFDLVSKQHPIAGYCAVTCHWQPRPLAGVGGAPVVKGGTPEVCIARHRIKLAVAVWTPHISLRAPAAMNKVAATGSQGDGR